LALLIGGAGATLSDPGGKLHATAARILKGHGSALFQELFGFITRDKMAPSKADGPQFS